MPKPLTQKEIDAVLSLYRGGATQREIRKRLGFSLSIIRKYLRRNGFRTADELERKKDEVAALFQSGKTMREIQQKTTLCITTVAKYLRLRGLDPSPDWKPERIAQCVELYQSGHSINMLASLLRASQKTIYKYLQQRGVPIRPKSYYSKGKRNPAWSGGRTIDKSGYVLLWKPEHPHCSRNGYVREHRLVMEQGLGRYLEPDEVVDHINGKKGDNRPGNLRLFSKNSEHLAATLIGKCPKWSAEGRRKLLAVAARRSREAKQKQSRPTQSDSPSPQTNELRRKARTSSPAGTPAAAPLAQ